MSQGRCARDQVIRSTIAGVLASKLDGTTAMNPEDMATALLSLGIGLGMQRVIDPSIPVDVLVKTLRALTVPGGSGAEPGSRQAPS